jgi:hypothetical protein
MRECPSWRETNEGSGRAGRGDGQAVRGTRVESLADPAKMTGKPGLAIGHAWPGGAMVVRWIPPPTLSIVT